MITIACTKRRNWVQIEGGHPSTLTTTEEFANFYMMLVKLELSDIAVRYTYE